MSPENKGQTCLWQLEEVGGASFHRTDPGKRGKVWGVELGRGGKCGCEMGRGGKCGCKIGEGGRVHAVGDVGLGRRKREDREEARQEEGWRGGMERRDGEEGWIEGGRRDREEGAESILRLHNLGAMCCAHNSVGFGYVLRENDLHLSL